MLQQLSLLFALFSAAHASGEFVVLHSPDSIAFTVNKEVELSNLKEILSVALGYTGKQKDTEHSIAILDPFSMPKALVAIPIDGVEFLPLMKDKTKIKYPLIVDEVEETTWQAIRSRIEERSNDNTLVRINLSDGVDALGQSALGELKPVNMEELKTLSSEVEEDRKFVEEMQLLHAIADNASSAKKHDSDADVYWLVLSTLGPLINLYGNDSAAVEEAYTLLDHAIEDIIKAFVNAYDGKVVITAFTNDASKVRNARSVLLERHPRDTDPMAYKTNSIKATGGAKGAPINSDFNDNLLMKRDDMRNQQNNIKDQIEQQGTKNSMSSTSESNTVDSTTEYMVTQDNSWTTSEKSVLGSNNQQNDINTNTLIGQPQNISGLAKIYSKDYPVIFNIILWFGVVFFFSLLAICITIADMDPGRDSIIYRMTSNRMKKDN